MEKRVKVTFSLDAQHAETIKTLAEEIGITQSNVVESAVDHWLKTFRVGIKDVARRRREMLTPGT
jgi:hypothetical protein